MNVHGQSQISTGHPYRATIAIEDGSEDNVTDVWARITPSFDGSTELYKLNVESDGIAVVHHASTQNATLLHVTVDESKSGPVSSEENRTAVASSAVLAILEILNGIENGVWSDI